MTMRAPSADAVESISFGCRLNLVESEAMQAAAIAAGHDDTIIINTCAVTSEAVRQARQSIRRAQSQRPDAQIVVTGCAAETARDVLGNIGERVKFLGNAHKTDAQAWQALRSGQAPSTDIMRSRNIVRIDAGVASQHTRAFLAVQNGCDHRCTFCIIPFGRGPSRSLPVADVVAHAQTLVARGHQDIALTGVDLASWGDDLDGAPQLGSLVRAILRDVPDLKRLRLSSLDCIATDDDLLRALAEEERLMPHLHLSLQSGDDMILKRMKRRHSRADAVRFCERARNLRPDLVMGADLIAGFPTETDPMFANTRALVRDCGLTHLHVFPFSPRDGTPAARMPPIAPHIARERAAELRALGDAALNAHLDSQIGRTLEVLSERGGTGHARDFTRVATPDVAAGQMVSVHIARHDGRMLHGEVVQ